MRILVFGLSRKLQGGIDSYIIGLQNRIGENIQFDYVMSEPKMESSLESSLKGKVIYVAPKRRLFKYLKSLRVIFNEHQNDYQILYFQLFSMVHAFPAFLARKYNYKIVLHSHTSQLNTNTESRLYPLLHYLIKKFLSNAKWVERFACSKVAGDFMYGKKTTYRVIHNTVDTERFKPNFELAEQTKESLKLRNKFVVGFVGRLTQSKNITFVIDIFKVIHDKKNNSVLLIVGDGELKTMLQDYAESYGLVNDVIFMGYCRDTELYYNVMDVLLLPSFYEGLPITLVEAQSSGVSCFASTEGVTDEVCISDGFVKYISLEEPAEVWAKYIISTSECSIDRIARNNAVKTSSFSIESGIKDIKESFYGIINEVQ